MRQLSTETQEYLRQAMQGVAPEHQGVALVKLISKDFYLYCERNLCIKDKITGAVIPLEFNWAQRTFVEMVIADLNAGVPVRYIILKARQMGISTIIEALCYWWTATHRNINSVIMAHEREASKNLYEMFRRYYANSHPSFQPSLKYNTKSDLTFDVEEDVKKAAMENGDPMPGLGSKILTLVAKDDTGRSGTNHFFHGSEVAAWDNTADVISGVLQTVPLAANTFAFLESTAKGVGGYFFQEWMSAEKGESQFKPFFLAWHDHAEYEMDAKGGMEPYTKREQLLIFGDPETPGEPSIFQKKGYSVDTIRRKIAWRRRKLLEFKTDLGKFDQEYPDTPMVAFLASGTYAFSISRVLQMQEIAKRDTTVKFAEVRLEKREGFPAEYVLDYVDFSPLKIWEPVKKVGRDGSPAGKYSIAVDVSEGIEVSSATGKEGDYSVIDIMNVKTMKTVARWRGHIDPDLLGDLVFELGTYYNNALVGVEANNHGIVTIQKLRNRFYKNLYHRETSEEEDFQTRTTLLGWVTNRKTKPLIIKNLAAAIRDADIVDLDPVFLGEALTYTANERGQYGGKENGHDDTVMAKAINLHLAEWSSYDVEYAKANIHKENNHKIAKHGSKNDENSDGKQRSTVAAERRAARSAFRAKRTAATSRS